jgi:hypothetical protein
MLLAHIFSSLHMLAHLLLHAGQLLLEHLVFSANGSCFLILLLGSLAQVKQQCNQVVDRLVVSLRRHLHLIV